MTGEGTVVKENFVATSPDGPRGPKERTRRLLVEAARQLLRDGGPLTVQAVADQAGVSRATAYRYFSSNDAVVLHATMPVGDDPLDDTRWAQEAGVTHENVRTRAAALVRVMGEWAFDHEIELRTVLRLSLSPDSEQRGLSRRGKTSRARWIAALLGDLPADVRPAARRRLAAALTPLFGADAIVWLTDIAGLGRDDALALLEWMAKTLVEATIRGEREGRRQ